MHLQQMQSLKENITLSCKLFIECVSDTCCVCVYVFSLNKTNTMLVDCCTLDLWNIDTWHVCSSCGTFDFRNNTTYLQFPVVRYNFNISTKVALSTELFPTTSEGHILKINSVADFRNNTTCLQFPVVRYNFNISKKVALRTELFPTTSEGIYAFTHL